LSEPAQSVAVISVLAVTIKHSFTMQIKLPAWTTEFGLITCILRTSCSTQFQYFFRNKQTMP